MKNIVKKFCENYRKMNSFNKFILIISWIIGAGALGQITGQLGAIALDEIRMHQHPENYSTNLEDIHRMLQDSEESDEVRVYTHPIGSNIKGIHTKNGIKLI
jgi:hypothetical protein